MHLTACRRGPSCSLCMLRHLVSAAFYAHATCLRRMQTRKVDNLSKCNVPPPHADTQTGAVGHRHHGAAAGAAVAAAAQVHSPYHCAGERGARDAALRLCRRRRSVRTCTRAASNVACGVANVAPQRTLGGATKNLVRTLIKLSLHTQALLCGKCAMALTHPFCICSAPGVGTLMQGASLLGGMAATATMQALALLPPADVAIKDFNVAYPVSNESVVVMCSVLGHTLTTVPSGRYETMHD